jgi:hypothetical protein
VCLRSRELTTIFNSVNGFLFTGGGLSLAPDSQYYQTALQLFNLALQANQNGDYFPGSAIKNSLLIRSLGNLHGISVALNFDRE